MIKWIVLGASALMLNNLILLYLLGFFSTEVPPEILTRDVVREVSPVRQVDREPVRKTIELSEERAPRLPTKGDLALSTDTLAVSDQPAETTSFEQEFRRFSRSEEFIAIMDRYTMSTGDRMMQNMQQYSTMSARELYDSYTNSQSSTDKQMALQALMQGKMGDLSTVELKDLYQASESELFGKYQVLQVLLEKNDAEALQWAKQEVDNPMLAMQGGYDIYAQINDKDPAFIREYVENLRVEDLAASQYSLSALLMQDQELAKTFYAKNLDQVLDSNSNTLFQMVPYNLQLDMNSDQQYKITELLGSGSRDKRNFAIGLVHNVSDPRLIRDGFAKLTRSQDQQTMLSTLITGASTENIKKLARELAAASDDPVLQQFAR